MEARSSYRQIVKATSLFGGARVFNLLIAVVRSKLGAILLGPVGMGIAGLFTSTIDVFVHPLASALPPGLSRILQQLTLPAESSD